MEHLLREVFVTVARYNIDVITSLFYNEKS